MNNLTILATQEAPTIGQSLPYLIGMVMVLATLTTLWGICAIISHIIRIVTPKPEPLKVTAPPAITPGAGPAPTQASGNGIAPNIVAVIAAAVASYTGGHGRVISIKQKSSGWEKAGRQSVLSSHRIR